MTQGEEGQKSRVPSWLVVATVVTVVLQPMQAANVHHSWTHCFAMMVITSAQEGRMWENARRHIRDELHYEWAAMAAVMSFCLGILWSWHCAYSKLPRGHSRRRFMNIMSILAFLGWSVLAGLISLWFVGSAYWRIVGGW
ncbi:MAG: hypothetical protein HY318_09760 [Armatimonadetes bacterium]|nr:hypothetical protein [Armatimonadota bacterium]